MRGFWRLMRDANISGTDVPISLVNRTFTNGSLKQFSTDTEKESIQTSAGKSIKKGNIQVKIMKKTMEN